MYKITLYLQELATVWFSVFLQLLQCIHTFVCPEMAGGGGYSPLAPSLNPPLVCIGLL